MSEHPEHPSIRLPDQQNYEAAHGLAYRLAVEKLADAASIEELVRRSGANLITGNSEKTIQLAYLNQLYRINFPQVEISRANDAAPVELRDKILILHYLITASGRPLSSELISFKALGEGLAYYPNFSQRVIQPLLTAFGQNPDNMLKSAIWLGGVKSDYGDLAATIPAFPRVPLTLVLWRGDDEFPPSVNILFDRTASDYLPLEDLIVLCQTVVWKMVKGPKN